VVYPSRFENEINVRLGLRVRLLVEVGDNRMRIAGGSLQGRYDHQGLKVLVPVHGTYDHVGDA
jgi:hypothetical protein